MLCLLQVEESTPFAKWYQPGTAPLPSDDASADMFRRASSVLQAAGYVHYEISSYAKPGHRCACPLLLFQGLACASFPVLTVQPATACARFNSLNT